MGNSVIDKAKEYFGQIVEDDWLITTPGQHCRHVASYVSGSACD